MKTYLLFCFFIFLITIKIQLNIPLYKTNKKFGKHLLNEFFFNPDFVNVNPGSFGAPPREVILKARHYQELMDSNPDKWLRYTIFKKLNETTKVIGDYINADSEDIVLVENASDGINSVMKSLLTNKGEKILIFDVAYGMVKSTIEYLHNTRGIEKVEIQLTEEILNSDDDKLLNYIESTIIENLPIKLASIDHISSTPAVIFPVKKISELLKKYNIRVMIDGAHTIGQIDLDIADINPDFYISSFHKWANVPKSAGFLWVAKQYQNLVHPNIISSHYSTGYVNEYSFTGTRDYSAYLSIKDALKFRTKYGDSEIKTYSRQLAWEAGLHVANIWNTELLVNKRERIGALINVRVPCKLCDDKLIKQAVDRTLFDHNTYLVIFKFRNGNFYARFSAQIFNELSDYSYAATQFISILNEVENKALLNNM